MDAFWGCHSRCEGAGEAVCVLASCASSPRKCYLYSPVPAAGLAGHSPAAGFPLDSVARQYSFWHDAGAFGGGQVGAAAGEGVHARRGLMR